jgi:glyoxylase-like metal-dependent hydrolase (beta-lactamase superfamily II)
MGRTPAYALSRLNETTYLIVQNDKYLEFPFIYVKIYAALGLIAVIDTGCGAQNARKGKPKIELKGYIERHISADWTTTPEYIVICTHCHFDHIGGIEPFAKAGASILASAYDPLFLDPSTRGKHSLCEAFGTETPQYEITKFLFYGEKIQHKGKDLGLLALHTQGHTPDSLTIYDSRERWLFSGDSVYKRVATMPWGEEQDVPIILPLQGNWKNFKASLRKLLAFVEYEDRGYDWSERIRLAAGHTTSDAVASEALTSVLDFVQRIERDEVPVVAKMAGDQVAPGGSLGDAEFWFWQDPGEPEFSLIAPEKFRRDFESVA